MQILLFIINYQLMSGINCPDPEKHWARTSQGAPSLSPAQPYPQHYVEIGYCGSCHSPAWLPLSAYFIKRVWLKWATKMCSAVLLLTKRQLTPPQSHCQR